MAHNGEIFKRLRLEKNLTMKEVAGDTVTPQFIRKFERGHSDIRLVNLQTLLYRMNVGTSEFLSDSQPNIDSWLLEIELEIEEAVHGSNSFHLKELIETMESLFLETKDKKYFFVKLLIERVYKEAFGRSKKPSMEPVTNYLRTCDQWGKFELFLVAHIHKDLGFSAEEKFFYGKRLLKNYYAPIDLVMTNMDAVLHFIFALLQEKELGYAGELLERYQNYFGEKDRPFFLTFCDLYAKFLQGLYFLSIGEMKGSEQCEKVIETFREVLGYKNYANHINIAYHQFKEKVL